VNRALAELGLPVDEAGHVVGFQVGKAAAIADWLHRKESAEFERLVARLRARNWVRKVYAEGGARLEDLRRKSREWVRRAAKTPTGRARLARSKERRRDRYRANAPVLTCQNCGAQWCRLPWLRGLAAHKRFCTESCRGKWKYRQRVGPTAYGRTINLVRAAVRPEWEGFGAIAARVSASPGSVGGTLRRLVEVGEVEMRGGGGRGTRAEYRRANGSEVAA
jgi:hypothetical protein